MRRLQGLPFVLLGSLILTAYFTYHAVYGSHGLQAHRTLSDRASVLERDLVRLEAVRAKLKRDVALLAPEQPHPDMVAIIAADVLGYVAADAIVVVSDAR